MCSPPTASQNHLQTTGFSSQKKDRSSIAKLVRWLRADHEKGATCHKISRLGLIGMISLVGCLSIIGLFPAMWLNYHICKEWKRQGQKINSHFSEELTKKKIFARNIKNSESEPYEVVENEKKNLLKNDPIKLAASSKLTNLELPFSDKKSPEQMVDAPFIGKELMEKRIHSVNIKLKRGDITKERVDVIVNAANSSLLGGGGVDGAIHRVGGPQILEACKRIGSCSTGKAVITTGGKLPAPYVVHTVGPIWKGGKGGEEQLLANAYANSLRLAQKNRAKIIAFPSISTGVYGYPVEEAARVALKAVQTFARNNTCIEEVRFILYSEKDYCIYEHALQKI